MVNLEQTYKSQLAQSRAKGKKSKKRKREAAPPPNPAEFILIGMLAVAADAIDALDLTGWGAIIARGVDIPVLGLLWLWRINKHISDPRINKKNPSFKMLLFFLAEISPFGIIPFWTAFVIYTWKEQKKS